MFASSSALVAEGDTVILCLARDNVNAITVDPRREFGSKFGTFKHADMIGLAYGSKIWSVNRKGFTHLLRPTPELWTLALPHRTQILYMPDIAFITQHLDVRPGATVVEAGTGSGSFSHAVARSVGAEGIVHSFEFHPDRHAQARAEFQKHGLTQIRAQHRDVCKAGFDLDGTADAVFLDLPAPWTAVEHAKKAMRKDRLSRICCFSPCAEQVIRTVAALHEHGFSDVTMYETLVRNYDTVSVELPTVGDVLTRLHATEAKKAERRESQMAAARQRKVDAAAPANEGASMNVDADETDAAPTSVQPSDAEAAPAPVEPTTSKRAADEEAANAPAAKRARVDEPRADSSGPATPAAPTTNGTAVNGVAARAPAQRVLSARPLVQTRGHTSFLTFATLAPHTVRPAAAPEPVAPEPVASERAPLGRSLSKSEMDDLCAGAMDTTQSTV